MLYTASDANRTFGLVQVEELRQRARACVTDGALTYDQKLRRLAAIAVDLLAYPDLSPACREALDERVICDLFEGNAPYTARYVLPDYATALQHGIEFLELDPPTDLAGALAFLQAMYTHVPSVTSYPVYLGDLDTLLTPFVSGSVSDDQLDEMLRLFWIGIDRMLPDAFVHLNIGPSDSRVARSILRVERSLRQAVPNITLKVDPVITPDDLIADGVRTVFETGKPHFVNHPMMVQDHGEAYAAVSCYNSLKVGGGAHTLVRLNLKSAAERSPHGLARNAGPIDNFLASALPHYVELTSELIEARIRSLVEEQRFFDTHWLAVEGLIDIDRFSAMFGVFGLAECVNHLMTLDHHTSARADTEPARYGHDAEANELGRRIIERVAELVAARPMPYCEGGQGTSYLHSQGGIDLDEGVTAGTRIPVGDEPPMFEHIQACAPHHRLFSAGISDIFHVDETAVRNPAAIVDVIRGAFEVGMRDFTFNLDDNEFVRITGYLVRKSDLEAIENVGPVRHASDHLAAGSENAFHLTQRATKRIRANERSPHS